MKINKDMIKTFNPCDPGYKNYLTHYSDFNGSFDEFLDLEHIPYADKIWLAKKILNKNQLVHFGLLCAESVLNIFESKYPEDKRVGDCIRFLQSKKDFSDLTEQEREEILKHKSAAYAAYTAYAANAADYAAYYAAHAAYAAAAWAASAAYDAAAYAAAYDADARIQQQNLNLQFLKMVASL